MSDCINKTLSERLAANAALVEDALHIYTAQDDADFAPLPEAMRYSLFAPRAKRIRPTVVFEFCRAHGGSDHVAAPLAAAVEMLHTYSLIHDDLPCMDDDDLRRGRPTCHKVHGEANALLAGDALLTRSFGVLAESEVLSPQIKTVAVAALAKAAGAFGMIGGQVMDLRGETERLDKDSLLKLHRNKTGALLRVSAFFGCLAADVPLDNPAYQRADAYAERIGLAFQIVDDVLDATVDEATAGKSVGSDHTHGKTTFLSYYTPQEALALAGQITEEAKAALGEGDNIEFLKELADYLISRKY